MILIAKTLTVIPFVDHTQQVRHQTRIKSNHICKFINARNIINDHQRNKLVENRSIVKYCKMNKRPKKGTIKMVIKEIHAVVIPLYNNKHTIKKVFPTQLFPFTYQII